MEMETETSMFTVALLKLHVSWFTLENQKHFVHLRASERGRATLSLFGCCHLSFIFCSECDIADNNGLQFCDAASPLIYNKCKNVQKISI